MDPAIRRGTWPNTTERYAFRYQSVAPSVEDMTSSYDDLATAAEMQADCRATSARLERAARQAGRPAPSIYFDEQPGEQAKREIQYSEAAARIAGALHFHLE
jgi:hypothetical protein